MWLNNLYIRSERSGSISPPNYLSESFVQGVKVGAVGTTSPPYSSASNGQIHQQTKHQSTTKQEQPTSKLQLTSKQQQLTSKQQQPTSKQQQPTSKQEQLISKQQSTSKQQQLTNQRQGNSVQQEPESQQYQQADRKQQTITEKLEANKQHQEMTEGQQKEHFIDNHSKHSSVNCNNVGPGGSLVEPMENDHAGTMDAWQSDQTHQEVDVKSKVVEDHAITSMNERIDDNMSPVSSESVTSPDLVHYKESTLDDGHPSLYKDDRLQQTSNQVSLNSPTHDPNRLTPQKRAISVDVLSPSSKSSIFFEQEHSVQLRHRSQTVLGEPRKKAPPIPVNKSPSTQSKKSISSHSSLGNLRRPVSIASAPGSNTSGMFYHGKFDILGVLRVRLRGVSIPDHTTELMEAPLPAAVHHLKGRSISAGAMALPEATHGIYCVFTINGGNTSAKSETCKILPYRPVLWEENEKEKLFFTNHSRQLFILCRKVPLLKKKSKPKASNEVCVGASVMKIIEINPTIPQQNTPDYTSTGGLQWYNKTLPLQPKGEIELSVSFEGM